MDALDRLAATIKERRTAPEDESYTRRLMNDPIKSAKKVGEEGVEVAIAATSQDKTALVSEAADLMYHLLVLLESRGATLDDVRAELARRMSEAEHKRRNAAAS